MKIRAPFSRRRTAVSEVIGSVLTIGLTILVGAAVFGYVNLQAGTVERQYGSAMQGTLGYIQERFVVAQVAYTSTSVTVYIYNNGATNAQFAQIEVYNATRSSVDIAYSGSTVTDLNNPSGCTVSASPSLESPSLLGTSSSSFTVNMNAISSITLTLPSCYSGTFVAGSTYYVNVLGQYGDSVTYFQGM